ncbi:MAG: phage portal protein [Clostridiales bacterium]|nr:phage portal protein [Clostridiales bacterium]
MPIRKKKHTDEVQMNFPQTVRNSSNPFGILDGYVPLTDPRTKLYYALREAVPVIDAAIFKLVRLIGSFELICSDKTAQQSLNRFADTVPVNGSRYGINSFISAYFEQLLTCGTSIGEMITDPSGRLAALYNAPLENVELKRGEDGFSTEVYLSGVGGLQKVRYPDLILLSLLNPDPGSVKGNSLLKGLPFISSVLMKIINTVGLNWERVGNVRFAVTYKPQNDSVDRAYAKERAMQMAREWGEAMQPGAGVRDFVTVGDVSIKVIGADNQILDSEVPVRQLLEQIVAKTGLPPFMLGLQWSSTERMSSQQADVLTSELEYYRGILSPVILKIGNMFLRSNGLNGDLEVRWNDITLQDQVELGRARLYNAQAEALENKKAEERNVKA